MFVVVNVWQNLNYICFPAIKSLFLPILEIKIKQALTFSRLCSIFGESYILQVSFTKLNNTWKVWLLIH